MRSTLLLVALSLLLFPLFILVTFTMQGAPSLDPLTNVLSDAVALCSVVGCWLVYRKMEKSFIDEKKGWGFIVLALFLFFLGDIAWTFYEVVLHVDVPLGSWPDLIWTLAYIILIIGMFFFLSMLFFESHTRNYLLVLLAAVIGGVLLYFETVGDMALQKFSFISFIQDSYVFFDLVLIAMLLILVVPLWQARNRLFVPWLLLAFAFISRIVFDFVFARLTDAELYYTGHPLDILYVFSYVLIVFAVDFKFKLLEFGGSRKKVWSWKK